MADSNRVVFIDTTLTVITFEQFPFGALVVVVDMVVVDMVVV